MKLWKLVSGSPGFTVGAADNDLLYTSEDVSRYDNIQIITDNPADIELSIDRGATWVGAPTVASLQDIHVAAAEGTRVIVTAATKMYRIAPGCRFTNFRVRQAGAGNVAAVTILATRSSKGVS